MWRMCAFLASERLRRRLALHTRVEFDELVASAALEVLVELVLVLRLTSGEALGFSTLTGGGGASGACVVAAAVDATDTIVVVATMACVVDAEGFAGAGAGLLPELLPPEGRFASEPGAEAVKPVGAEGQNVNITFTLSASHCLWT